MRIRNIGTPFLCSLSIIACIDLYAAPEQRTVKGGDTAVKVTFTSTDAPFTIQAIAAGDWKFKTANVSSASSWSNPGNVENDISVLTSLSQLGSTTFTVELFGDMIPPPGGGTGPIDYKITGYLDGEFSVVPIEKFILPSQTATFHSFVGSTNTPSTWTASPTWPGYSAITTPTSPIMIGYNHPWMPPVGAYIITAQGPSDSADAWVTVVGLELQKKEYTDNDYVALTAGCTLKISPGDAGTEPNMPLVKAVYTGSYDLSDKMRYVVQKSAESKTYNIKGYERNRSRTLQNAVGSSLIFISGTAYNGGIIRTVDGTSGGITITYKANFVADAPTNTVPFNIIGTNPSYSAINSFVDARQNLLTGTCNGVSVDMKEYYKKMLYHESSYKQFNSSGTFANEPNWGYPHGWGIAQVDFGYGAPSGSSQTYNYTETQLEIMWNWHANINAGIGVLQTKFSEVSSLISQIRNWHSSLPMLSEQQLKKSYVVAYNGFNGTATVKIGETELGQDITILFCYPGGASWGAFSDNVNNYWAVVDGTDYPQ